MSTKQALVRMFTAADAPLAPFVFASTLLLGAVRRAGVQQMPIARAIFRRLGVLPVTRHYYDPFAASVGWRQPLDTPRPLPGLDMNLSEQLELLQSFTLHEELLAFPLEAQAERGFHYRNGTYGPGDAEFLYSFIRMRKPQRLIEIGAGSSTLIAAAAIARNRADDADYRCAHICIEPYENEWLETLGVEVVRKPVETVDRTNFARLGRNDVLFIDSSHIIRPQGDVLAEYLEILPTLAPGVYVHVHDIFTPRNYPGRWLNDAMLLWNEQYLLEAFLCFNREFRVIGALNMLYHDHRPALEAACPVLAKEGGPEPGSFWFVRNG